MMCRYGLTKKKMFANVTVSSEAKNYGDHLQKKCLFYT